MRGRGHTWREGGTTVGPPSCRGWGEEGLQSTYTLTEIHLRGRGESTRGRKGQAHETDVGSSPSRRNVDRDLAQRPVTLTKEAGVSACTRFGVSNLSFGLSTCEAQSLPHCAASLFSRDGLFHHSAHLRQPLVLVRPALHLESFKERFHVHGLAVAPLCSSPAASIQRIMCPASWTRSMRSGPWLWSTSVFTCSPLVPDR